MFQTKSEGAAFSARSRSHTLESVMPTQSWAIGQTVKVGFCTLRVLERTGYGYVLVSLDGTKQYLFEPYLGLRRIYR